MVHNLAGRGDDCVWWPGPPAPRAHHSVWHTQLACLTIHRHAGPFVFVARQPDCSDLSRRSSCAATMRRWRSFRQIWRQQRGPAQGVRRRRRRPPLGVRPPKPPARGAAAAREAPGMRPPLRGPCSMRRLLCRPPLTGDRQSREGSCRPRGASKAAAVARASSAGCQAGRAACQVCTPRAPAAPAWVALAAQVAVRRGPQSSAIAARSILAARAGA
jgi:hypothetical protein